MSGEVRVIGIDPSMRMHVRVTGMVQGVGFRWFVRQRARRLGVSGWVRNLPDGSVEVAAEGGADQVEALRSELQRGPPGAMVAAVSDLASSPREPLFDPFDIIH